MTLKILLTVFFASLAYLIFTVTGVLGLALIALMFDLLTSWFSRGRFSPWRDLR